MTSSSVLVVGAGISGLACAQRLRQAGVGVHVVDRGRGAGGRMSSRTLHGRPVDLGASYFTAEPGTPFDAIVQGWVDRGLARTWTDTFALAGVDGIRDHRTGPMRYAAPFGLREVVVDLGRGLAIEPEHEVSSVSDGPVADGIRYDAVVLAMPDPQAKRILDPELTARGLLHEPEEWEPTIAVALGWDSRQWPGDLHGAFVNDSPAVGFIADDGDRRGDGAPVLVAHSTAQLARQHLEEPDASSAPIANAVAAILDITTEPVWAHAHRWTFARPSTPHDEPFLLADGIGVCGDAWGGKSSVTAAWTSGDALGRALAVRLTN